jgi:signal transduction histidine kinase
LLVVNILAISLSFASACFSMKKSLRNQFDGDLRTKLLSFVVMGEWPERDSVETEGYDDYGDDATDDIQFEFSEVSFPEFEPSSTAEYFQVWDTSGTTLARSHSLLGRDLPKRTPTLDTVDIQSITLPDGSAGSLATIRFHPTEFHGVKPAGIDELLITMSIAKSLREVDESALLIRNSLLFSVLVAIIIISFSVVFAVKKGLIPLNALGEEIDAIGTQSGNGFTQRLNSESLEMELVPIAICLNRLIDRVEESLRRERNFNANVAHELRTPVSELLALADTCMSRDNLDERAVRSYRNTKTIAQKMKNLITSLLELSRCESGQISTEVEIISLERFVREVSAPFESDISTKEIEFKRTVDSGAKLSTDPVLFGTILSNLIANAVEYTPEGGQIKLDVEVIGTDIQIALTNSSMYEFSDEDIERILDAFWRKEESRSNAKHLGLGLSLVAAITAVLGIELAIDTPSPETFRIRLLCPIESAL